MRWPGERRTGRVVDVPVRTWALATIVAMLVAGAGVRDIAHRVADPLQLGTRSVGAVDASGAIALRARPAPRPSAPPAGHLVESADDDGGAPVTAAVVAPARPAAGDPPVVLAGPWHFDEGLDGWRVEGNPGTHDTRWEWQPQGAGDGSGSVGLTVQHPQRGRIEGYGDGADLSLVSPPIDLAGRSGWLDFRLRTELEGNGWDHLHVEVLREGTGSWIRLATYGGGPATFGAQAIELPASGRFQVRFRLISDVLGSTVTPNPELFVGAWVDRVVVRSGPPSVVSFVPEEGAPIADPQVVVGMFHDVAINPYHEQFRDDRPRAWRHPATYLPGYPTSALPLPLTLDAPSLEEAILRDREVWDAVIPDQLYWVPGTRLVGLWAGPDGETSQGACEPWCNLSPQPGRERHPHGEWAMWSASRAVGTETGSCGDCLLVVASGWDARTVHFVEQNLGWIDLAYSTIGGLFVDDSPATAIDEGWVDAEASIASHALLLHPAQNEANLRPGVLGSDAAPDAETDVGMPAHDSPSGLVPGVITVGVHDSGHVVPTNVPDTMVVADTCDSFVARAWTLDEVGHDGDDAERTAVSWAAGHTGAVLLEARRLLDDHGQRRRPAGVVAIGTPPAGLRTGPLADGELTREEWRTLVLHTASPRPDGQPRDGAQPCTTDVASDDRTASTALLPWSAVPPEAPGFVNAGYGALDDVALDLARRVLRGEAGAPDRTIVDRWLEPGQEARRRVQALSWWRQFDHWLWAFAEALLGDESHRERPAAR